MRPIRIGVTDTGGPLYLTPHDLDTHVHGVGSSRSGKSKFIENLARQCFANRQGFCLIDPHGSLYEDLVRWLAYVKPRTEVVLFNPSEDRRIVGFNPLRRSDRGEVSVQVDTSVLATVKASGQADTEQTPRLERRLRGLYSALIYARQPLPAAKYLLSWEDKAIRQYLVNQIPEGLIRSQWEQLEHSRRPEDFDTQLESTLNRIGRFLDRKQLQRVMGLDVNNIDLEDIIENGKVLLVNLQPSTVMTEFEARILGTLLLTEIWEIAKARKTLPGGKPRSHWFLILDEFQNFLVPDMPRLLSEATKRGIHCFLFHQFLSQLETEDKKIHDAIMGNAQVKIVFGGLDWKDAEAMANRLFAGQLNLTEIKQLIEHTVFWPQTEDVAVTTTSRGRARQSGESFDEDDPDRRRLDERETETFNETTTMQPRTTHEMHKEIKEEYWSLEEQRYKAASSLIRQYQRHFFIRRPGQDTISAETPHVETFYVKPEMIAAYTDRLLAPFLPPAEVDRLLEVRRAKLLEDAGQGPKALADFDGGWEPVIEVQPVADPTPKPIRRRKPSPKR